MKQWRDLRDKEPAMFADILVWQQPAAFVDSVVYQWQQKDEASRYNQIVRLVDCFAGGWSATSQESNFLLQTLQGA
eukprot:8596826-Heterocapsa_arctica.AAC.1